MTEAEGGAPTEKKLPSHVYQMYLHHNGVRNKALHKRCSKLCLCVPAPHTHTSKIITRMENVLMKPKNVLPEEIFRVY